MVTTNNSTHQRPSWGWLAILGAISFIGGILGLLNPFAATLTAALLIGWTFLIFGVLQIIQSFQMSGRGGGFFWNLILGLLMGILGVSLIFRPLEGIISLTILAAIVFIALGVVKTIYAFGLRPASGWGWILLSGLVSFVLGIMILAEMPWAASAVLGILLAVELLSNGAFMLLLAFAIRNMSKA